MAFYHFVAGKRVLLVAKIDASVDWGTWTRRMPWWFSEDSTTACVQSQMRTRQFIWKSEIRRIDSCSWQDCAQNLHWQKEVLTRINFLPGGETFPNEKKSILVLALSEVLDWPKCDINIELKAMKLHKVSGFEDLKAFLKKMGYNQFVVS
jgi:hypothetical protein